MTINLVSDITQIDFEDSYTVSAEKTDSYEPDQELQLTLHEGQVLLA